VHRKHTRTFRLSTVINDIFTRVLVTLSSHAIETVYTCRIIWCTARSHLFVFFFVISRGNVNNSASVDSDEMLDLRAVKIVILYTPQCKLVRIQKYASAVPNSDPAECETSCYNIAGARFRICCQTR